MVSEINDLENLKDCKKIISQTDKKFGFYAGLTLKRIDKEVKNHINSKYEK